MPELPPVSDGSGQDRRLLREASELLDQAGWASDSGLRKNAKGEILSAEFLIESPVFERILAPFVKNLKLLGVDASIRIVDDAQYQSRRKSFNYDILSNRFASGVTPGARSSGFLWNCFRQCAGKQHLRCRQPLHRRANRASRLSREPQAA